MTWPSDAESGFSGLCCCDSNGPISSLGLRSLCSPDLCVFSYWSRGLRQGTKMGTVGIRARVGADCDLHFEFSFLILTCRQSIHCYSG